jgi:hypothetical protein
MNLVYARIISKDVTALPEFYRAITGIVPVVRNPDYVEFRPCENFFI